MSENSPLTEANSASLDEYFSRRPPYDAETLARIKQEFRRMREKWQQFEQGQGAKPKTKRSAAGAKARATSTEVDIFGSDPEATP